MNRQWWWGYLCGCLMAGVSTGLYHRWNPPTIVLPAACVPAEAVDYDGPLGAWLAADGSVLLIATEEDTYDWCNG